MVRYENECIGCRSIYHSCLVDCPYKHVAYYACDECGDEVEELYEYGYGEQLCMDCLIKRLVQDKKDLLPEGGCEKCKDRDEFAIYEYEGEKVCLACVGGDKLTKVCA